MEVDLKYFYKWETKWEDSYATEWEQQVYNSLGYKVDKSIPATMDEAIEDGYDPLCDKCYKRDERKNAVCDGCHKTTHLHCMQERDATRFITAETKNISWYCCECRATIPDNPTEADIARLDTMPHVVNARVYKTSWAPMQELETQLLKNPYLRARIEQYITELEDYCALGPIKKSRPDAHMTAKEQQGILKPEPNPKMKTLGDSCRRNVKIHTKPINPHLDTTPTGRYSIQIRNTQTYQEVRDKATKKTQGYTEGPYQDMACVYDPEGCLVGTLTPERLAVLRIKYTGTGHFEQEIAELLERYKDGSGSTRINNHWTTPPQVMEALMEANSITRERYASPLNFHPNMANYWSMYEKDKLFGAEGNALESLYTGSSESNPEYEDTDMTKALTRAAHSAIHNKTTPVMTTMILPAWDQHSSTSYLSWIKNCPAVCQVMMRIPAKQFKFLRPTHWADASSLEGCPRWDVNIIIVANEKGFDKYYKCTNTESRTALCVQLAEALNSLQPERKITMDQVDSWITLPPGWKPDAKAARDQIQLTTPEMGMRLPRSLRAMPRDTNMSGKTVQENDIQRATATLKGQYPEGELKFNWKTLAYTDGSLKKVEDNKTLVGAAVYLPDKETGLKGQFIRIDPSPGGVHNTINRAELVALHELLKRSQTEEGWNNVATDSLTSMRLIWKAVTNPANMADHLHKDLLDDIARIIGERDTPLNIYKIKSHMGMVGNELADLGANQATLTRDTQNHTGATNYRPGHWVSTKPKEEEGGTQEGKAASDLRAGLRKHAHREHRLGDAKLDGIYASSWRDTVPIADTAISSLFVQKNLEGITESCRRQTLLYRTGGLVTQKTLHRWGKITSPNCLLCGQLDGGHHAISGCPALSVPATERHNQMGRIIAEAVCSGRHGGRVVMLDVGNPRKLAESGLPRDDYSRYLPTEYFPGHLTEEERRSLQLKHRVDIAVNIPDQDGTTVLHLVELKTCRDTSRDDQVERAAAQHVELRELLDAAGRKHEMHVIAIGVSGTIYKDTKATLEALGVDKKETKDILKRLHICMVKWVGTMLSIRRDKLASCPKDSNNKSGKHSRTPQEGRHTEPWWKRNKPSHHSKPSTLGKHTRTQQGNPAGEPDCKKSRPNQGQKRNRGVCAVQAGDGRANKRSRLNDRVATKRRIPEAWVKHTGGNRPAKRAKGGGEGIAPNTIK